MILSGLEINKRIGADIIIEPYDRKRVNSNSYNLRLHDELLTYTGIPLDSLPFAEWKKQSARWFLNRGVKAVCITLGSSGAYFFDGTQEYDVPAFSVSAVDTTAAGDAFNGGFAYGIAHKLPVARCLEIGNACGALAATVLGAQNSIHNIGQIKEFLRERKIEI